MKYSLSDTYFTSEEKAKIEQAIGETELITTGEVVAIVVGSSDHYPEAAIIGAGFFASVISLATAKLFFASSLWHFILLQILLFFPLRYLFEQSPFFKALFIGPRLKRERVRQKALQTFHEKELHKTRYRTSVLFFLSIYERTVWVLADKGIYEKIHQDTLESFAQAVSLGMKEGRGCDALCKAIRDTGALLSTHFPAGPGDINELSNKVITGE